MNERFRSSSLCRSHSVTLLYKSVAILIDLHHQARGSCSSQLCDCCCFCCCHATENKTSHPSTDRPPLTPSLPPTHSQPFRHSVWYGCVSLLPFHRSVPLFPFCFHPIASRATIVRRNQSCLSPPTLLLPKTHRRIPPSEPEPEPARVGPGAGNETWTPSLSTQTREK